MPLDKIPTVLNNEMDEEDVSDISEEDDYPQAILKRPQNHRNYSNNYPSNNAQYIDHNKTKNRLNWTVDKERFLLHCYNHYRFTASTSHGLKAKSWKRIAARMILQYHEEYDFNACRNKVNALRYEYVNYKLYLTAKLEAQEKGLNDNDDFFWNTLAQSSPKIVKWRISNAFPHYELMKRIFEENGDGVELLQALPEEINEGEYPQEIYKKRPSESFLLPGEPSFKRSFGSSLSHPSLAVPLTQMQLSNTRSATVPTTSSMSLENNNSTNNEQNLLEYTVNPTANPPNNNNQSSSLRYQTESSDLILNSNQNISQMGSRSIDEDEVLEGREEEDDGNFKENEEDEEQQRNHQKQSEQPSSSQSYSNNNLNPTTNTSNNNNNLLSTPDIHSLFIICQKYFQQITLQLQTLQSQQKNSFDFETKRLAFEELNKSSYVTMMSNKETRDLIITWLTDIEHAKCFLLYPEKYRMNLLEDLLNNSNQTTNNNNNNNNNSSEDE